MGDRWLSLSADDTETRPSKRVASLPPHALTLIIVLDGELPLGPPGRHEALIVRRLQACIFACEAHALLPRRVRDGLRGLQIRIGAESFGELFGNALPARLLQAVAEPHFAASACAPLTPEMALIAHRTLSAKVHELARPALYRARALELLALFVGLWFEGELDAAPATALIRPDEVGKVLAAERLVAERMRHPPTISALAREIGLNEFKLKRGFRQMFGSPIYAYIKEKRLSQAQVLFDRGRTNVKQVAWLVGYTCSSTFAGNFKQRFGVRPSDYLMARRGACAAPDGAAER